MLRNIASLQSAQRRRSSFYYLLGVLLFAPVSAIFVGCGFREISPRSGKNFFCNSLPVMGGIVPPT